MKKNILITGGCGFIGSHFIRYLMRKYPEYQVINVDKLTYAGNKNNLKDVETNENYKFIKGDICDSEVVFSLVKDCDIIVNFAAETHVDRSISCAESFIKTNVYGTYLLLEAARKFHISRFVHISTDEVYGSILEGKFKEEDVLQPNSPYAASKAGADLLCRAYAVTYKLSVVITRSSNNFGPYQYPEKVIPLFITNALEDKSLPVYGDGMNIRDWIYVEDNCEAIACVLERGRDGHVYNIGGGYEITNIDLARYILNILDKPQNLIQFVKDRLGHDKRYALEGTKIGKLGWQPKYKFREALEKTVFWYKENEEWWKLKTEKDVLVR